MLQNNCTPCTSESKAINSIKAIGLLDHLSENWSLNLKHKLFASYKLNNYAEALQFITKISKIAEQQQHHPDLNFGWGYVEITLYTHALMGLHENDFILASKIDKLTKSPPSQQTFL